MTRARAHNNYDRDVIKKPPRHYNNILSATAAVAATAHDAFLLLCMHVCERESVYMCL